MTEISMAGPWAQDTLLSARPAGAAQGLRQPTETALDASLATASETTQRVGGCARCRVG